MMDGRLAGYSLNRDGTQNITVCVPAEPSYGAEYDELKDYPVTITIRKARKHRSLEANAYCWILIDRISEKTGIKKRDVYRNAIREIGGVSEIMIVKLAAAETFIRIWESQGAGNQAEVLETEEETGWATIRIYYGSSTYDTAQMHRLIESLIQDAEALGIPTITPAEEERMLGNWSKKKEGKHNGNADARGARDA